MSKLQEFFSKKWVLIVAPILYFIGVIGYDGVIMVADLRSGAYYLGCEIFVAAVVLVVCFSYAKHNKNVMKTVLGGVLMYTCSNYIYNALGYTFYYDPEYNYWFDIVFSVAMAVLAILFLVNHLVMASKHTPSPVIVNLNMVVGLLLIACAIAWETLIVIMDGTPVYYAVIWVLYNMGLVALVMNIESKIDYFKQVRAEKAAAEEPVAPIEQ